MTNFRYLGVTLTKWRREKPFFAAGRTFFWVALHIEGTLCTQVSGATQGSGRSESAGVSNYPKIGERPGIGLPVDIKNFHRGGTRNFDFEKYFGSIFENSPSNNSPLK